MTFVLLFLVGFSGAITPGPDILLVLRNTLLFGFWSGIRVLCGIATGWVVFLGIIYFGLAHFLSYWISQIILSIIGALYLLYIAYKIFRAAPAKLQILDSHTTLASKPDSYIKGLIVNLSNPKAILFFGVIVARFIDTNLVLSIIVLFASLMCAFLSVVFVATFFRKYITNKVFIWIDRVCIVLFSAFALSLVYNAFVIFQENISS